MPGTKTAKSESLYGVHPGVAMAQKSLAELKEKTGRSLEEWIALVKEEGLKDEKSQREWLKTKHKLGMNRAGWIAERADGKGGDLDTPEVYLKSAFRYVEEQYAGPKEKLRPIYEELLMLGKSMGNDVKACVQNDCAALSRACVRANQADNEFKDRSWLRPDTLQRKAAQTADRYRRIGEKRPHHASHGNYGRGTD